MVSAEGEDQPLGGGAEGHPEQHQDEKDEVEMSEDLDDDEEYGIRRPRICRRPLAPTKAEVEEHNRTHAEYRSWCPHCVRGKSVAMHHRRGDPDEEKLGVTISIDYAFKSAEEAEDDISPVLVAFDDSCSSIWVLEVEHKGVDSNVGVE